MTQPAVRPESRPSPISQARLSIGQWRQSTSRSTRPGSHGHRSVRPGQSRRERRDEAVDLAAEAAAAMAGQEVDPRQDQQWDVGTNAQQQGLDVYQSATGVGPQYGAQNGTQYGADLAAGQYGPTGESVATAHSGQDPNVAAAYELQSGQRYAGTLGADALYDRSEAQDNPQTRVNERVSNTQEYEYDQNAASAVQSASAGRAAQLRGQQPEQDAEQDEAPAQGPGSRAPDAVHLAAACLQAKGAHHTNERAQNQGPVHRPAQQARAQARRR